MDRAGNIKFFIPLTIAGYSFLLNHWDTRVHRLKKTNQLLKIYRTLYAHLGPQGWWPARTRLEIIVGVVLTQNTAWSNVEKAIRNLKKAGVLTLRELYRIPENRLARLITPAGYYNVKARRLKNVITVLQERYQGSLTKLFRRPADELRAILLGINGLGPESADSIILYAAGKPVFVVDTYTKRIFSRHQLVSSDASYDEVQGFFTDRLPDDTRLFNEYHALIVMTGKHYCRNNRRCSTSPLQPFL